MVSRYAADLEESLLAGRYDQTASGVSGLILMIDAIVATITV